MRRGIGRGVGLIGLLLGRGCEFTTFLESLRGGDDGADGCRLGLSDFLMGKVVERLRELESKTTE